jgi:hypothetical protein
LGIGRVILEPYVAAKEFEERLEGGDAGCDYEGASFDSCFFI